MRNLKKILSLALALVMVLSMMVTASAAFEDQDLINDKYAEAVDVMVELGILQGDGTNFDPNGTLTRAQAAVILSKVLCGPDYEADIEDAASYVENPFTDVPAWALPYVLYCYQENVLAGRGNGIYDPNGTLRGYDFAKMLLIAAGYGVHEDYVGDTNKTYETKVLEAAKEAKLLAGLPSTMTLSKSITREQAAQMALNALTAGTNETLTWDVKIAEYPTYTKNFENPIDAELYAAQMTAIKLTATVEPNYEVTGGLLKEVYGVDRIVAGADPYGRPATTYVFPDGEGGTYNLYFNIPETLITYTNTVTAADVKVLTDAKTKIAEGTPINANGVYTTTVDTLAELVNLGGANSVVEVYTNSKGVINNIVVVDTQVAFIEVGDLSKDAKKVEYVKIGDLDPVKNAYGLKAGDVVAYTVNKDGLDTVTKLEGTTAKVTGLSKFAGVETYTINGAYYTLDGADAGVVKGALSFGTEVVCYFGANNTVVYAHAPVVEGEDPVATVYNNFAVVLGAPCKIETEETTDIWGNKSFNWTAQAGVELLLADGKVVKVPVEIKLAADDIKDAKGNVLVAEDEFYYVVGNEYKVVAANATELTALADKVVAYDDGVINFAPTFDDLDEKTSGNVYAVLEDTTVTSKTPAVNGIIVNSNTVFVVAGEKANTYTTVKGQAALGENEISAGVVIYQAKWVASADGKSGTYVKTALVVFSGDKLVETDPEVVPVDYVMWTGYTTVEWDAKAEAWVNVHSMMKTDGTFATVKLYGDEKLYEELYGYTNGVGLYVLNSDGTLATYKVADTEYWTYFNTNGEIKTVSESFVEVAGDYVGTTNNGWLMTNSKTVVYGDLVAGNYAFWADGNADGYVDVIFCFAQ